MEFHVSLVDRQGLSEQIYRQMRAGIRDGRLRPAEGLPSSRELADRLRVSRNTVTAAYDRLGAEGLIESRAGVGVFVRDAVTTQAPGPAGRSEPAAAPQPQPLWDSITTPEDLSATEPEFDFRGGIPSLHHFPYSTWRSMVSRQLRASAANAAYAEPAGSPALRGAVARHVGVSRGVHASPDDVFITSGIQQALDLIARVVLAPGDIVAVEDPGYPPPTLLFRSLRMRVVGVPVDAEGLVVSEIPEGTRLVYVTPSHQFPLGMSMSLGRRRQLLDWADRTGAVIVEDDYDSEFRFAGRPLETVQSIDESWRVLYVGSFSKTMLPTLRLGFVVVPPSLFPAMRKAKLVTDWHTALPMQDALAQFIDDGHFARHIRRMRRIYEGRHQLIVSQLETRFDELLERVPSVAGIHVAALLRPEAGIDDTAVARRARRRGVDLHVPISRFAVTLPPRRGFMFGYGAIPTERIREGMHRLHESFPHS